MIGFGYDFILKTALYDFSDGSTKDAEQKVPGIQDRCWNHGIGESASIATSELASRVGFDSYAPGAGTVQLRAGICRVRR